MRIVDMLSDRLRVVRELRGYTQDELGEMIGKAKLQISRWENGQNDPSSKMLAQLARALNVSADYLLGLSDDLHPSLSDSELSLTEQSILEAVRRGDVVEAIRVIMAGG